MKMLALDTSSIVATVAILDEDKLVGEYILNHKKTHSQKLMPMIEDILKSCELTPKDIDVFAVALGPGSFTGLRIGLATIKAMAQALEKPVIGVSTLEALTYNLPYAKELVCPILDAQRDLVYTGLYQWQQGEFIKVMEEEVVTIEALLENLKTRGEKVIFLGDALEKFRGVILQELKENAIIPPAIVRMPRASSVAELASRRRRAGNLQKASEVLPIYMRKSQAENQWEERMNKGK
ncbi:tRNA (adenosine(37)-N6)-threonylcarbamoyltransferase complex dimerization subunit type 1 TsaB [Natronincola ferrireducens]|uniref:tRNA threonylcarbamoyladenosine biosynthesis protein TsaB n=1 Tax=Natronincola ferrireducens TaxID=393762 RepID=A0A1G8XSP1_9FIRM|nr:tRNA (adenosine(37)-N6)-threonylcarbamoyltransferase complex dimerization subunit type 1 TsaB [Natronincola ferrireducens]SDJ93571.1 tRNA threonylcarbamoyladenosine biosynthesis protein TsaB [Natronincola ferrireducens]